MNDSNVPDRPMFHHRQNFLALATVSLVSLAPAIAVGAATLSETSKAVINGLGPVKVGMTPAEATRAAGIEITKSPGANDPTCTYYKPGRGLTGVSFMVVNGKIARIDIDNPRITTRSGARVGDSEEKVKSLYGNTLTVQPHKYVPRGHYLIFTPKDAADKNYRLLFETDGKKVTRWRIGKVPEVMWVEGCS